MAVVRWNFPNGSSGDLLTPELAGADSMNFGDSGTPTLSNSYPIDGVGLLSARFSLDGGGHLWVARDGLSATSYAYQFYAYQDEGGPGGNVHMGWAGASSSARSLAVMMGGSQGRLQLYDSTGAVWSNDYSANPVPVNQWVRVSVYGTCESAEGAADGTGRVAWYLGHDVTPQEESPLVTGLTTHTLIDRIRVGGKAASSSVVGGVVHIGSWAYDTAATGLIGPAVQSWQAASWQRRSAGGWGPMVVRKRQDGVWQDNGSSIR